MPDARLVVEVRQREDAEGLAVDLGAGPVLLAAGPDGVDEVEFLLVPHPGAPARPIAKWTPERVLATAIGEPAA